MDTTRPKLYLTTSRIRILNVVTFLMLTALTVAEEGNSTRQCYWCGPIAELVHRSEVAPPCGPQNSVVFNCQEGHNYCAIAASSPPYTESRFCSKVYQDECYPQYCNTTKKWRMTCTCRGDLCNENITKRETDAFATLPRHVEHKEPRDKRDTNSANSVLAASEKTVIITNLTSVLNHTYIPNDNLNENHTTQLIIPDPKISVHIIPSEEELFQNPSTPSATTESKEMINRNLPMKKENSDEGIDKVDKITVQRKNEITDTSVKDVILPKIIGTTKMTKTYTVNTNTPKPSEKLPSAEALQQEASSENEDDNTDHTTMEYEPTGSDISDNDDDNNVTTEPEDAGDSSAKINDINMIIFLNGLLLQFIQP